ncbi:hypothetical protein BCR32DRAFT_247834 [Anaeromyces robustus]|uniref:Uncharacterized protein n=1 Tax=Anaeromyces robustus TaxID=1754192 RepID=A0A1Y1WVX9_9FUNG|nr:hypothetical protein BCR32DRAFT_247834 [Anaeromyces robustus]|eukprot:ORX77555.1 hypothetical protein BCR32DRAFT_247834 [Anaeromyces robustus]
MMNIDCDWCICGKRALDGKLYCSYECQIKDASSIASSTAATLSASSSLSSSSASSFISSTTMVNNPSIPMINNPANSYNIFNCNIPRNNIPAQAWDPFRRRYSLPAVLHQSHKVNNINNLISINNNFKNNNSYNINNKPISSMSSLSSNCFHKFLNRSNSCYAFYHRGNTNTTIINQTLQPPPIIHTTTTTTSYYSYSKNNIDTNINNNINNNNLFNSSNIYQQHFSTSSYYKNNDNNSENLKKLNNIDENNTIYNNSINTINKFNNKKEPIIVIDYNDGSYNSNSHNQKECLKNNLNYESNNNHSFSSEDYLNSKVNKINKENDKNVVLLGNYLATNMLTSTSLITNALSRRSSITATSTINTTTTNVMASTSSYYFKNKFFSFSYKNFFMRKNMSNKSKFHDKCTGNNENNDNKKAIHLSHSTSNEDTSNEIMKKKQNNYKKQFIKKENEKSNEKKSNYSILNKLIRESNKQKTTDKIVDNNSKEYNENIDEIYTKRKEKNLFNNENKYNDSLSKLSIENTIYSKDDIEYSIMKNISIDNDNLKSEEPLSLEKENENFQASSLNRNNYKGNNFSFDKFIERIKEDSMYRINKNFRFGYNDDDQFCLNDYYFDGNEDVLNKNQFYKKNSEIDLYLRGKLSKSSVCIDHNYIDSSLKEYTKVNEKFKENYSNTPYDKINNSNELKSILFERPKDNNSLSYKSINNNSNNKLDPINSPIPGSELENDIQEDDFRDKIMKLNSVDSNTEIYQTNSPSVRIIFYSTPDTKKFTYGVININNKNVSTGTTIGNENESLLNYNKVNNLDQYNNNKIYAKSIDNRKYNHNRIKKNYQYSWLPNYLKDDDFDDMDSLYI